MKNFKRDETNIPEHDLQEEQLPTLEGDIIGDFVKEFSMGIRELDDMEIKEVDIVDGVFFMGQVLSIVARPNGGKTLLAQHWASIMAQNGYRVIYIYEDADMNGYRMASMRGEEFGYSVMSSFANIGQTPQTILNRLREISERSESLHNVVVIVDTLKKFTEVLSKPENKAFFSLMRGVAMKEGSVLLLGHANKYLDDNGKLVYEGTGDMLSDVDSMYYLYDDGNKKADVRKATLIYEKGRAIANKHEVSYEFDLSTYTARKLDYIVNVKKIAMRMQFSETFEEEIIYIVSHLKQKPLQQKDVVDLVSEEFGHGKNKIIGLLRMLDGHNWESYRVGERNEKKVFRIISLN